MVAGLEKGGGVREEVEEGGGGEGEEEGKEEGKMWEGSVVVGSAY